MNNIKHHRCSNGLQIITEFIPNTKTVAVNWGVRAGVAMNEHDGESVLLAELIQRGVGGKSAKQHNDSLDSTGVKRHITCGVEYLRISAVLLGKRLFEAMPLLAAYLLSPNLSENHLVACKSICLQSLHSLADNPSLLAAIALNTNHLARPFNRSSYGVPECIEAATIDQLHSVYRKLFVPNNSIVVVSGDVEHQGVVCEIEKLISGWGSIEDKDVQSTPSKRGAHWVEQDSSQVHLSLAFDAPNANEDSSILESVAMMIFGGSSSGRLFTQVRQRRSLCYSVSAQYARSKHRSVVRVHAGTTPERAQETVEICLEQLEELKNGISKEEFDRTILKMKARTVMHGESTTARASALWSDQYALEKTRSLEDRLQEINDVSFDAVNAWLAQRKFGSMTFVAVGPEHITVDNNALYD